MRRTMDGPFRVERRIFGEWLALSASADEAGERDLYLMMLRHFPDGEFRLIGAAGAILEHRPALALGGDDWV